MKVIGHHLKEILAAFFDGQLKKSQCDQFAIEHFHFSAGGYVFEGELEIFYKELEAGRYEQLEDIEEL